MSQDDLKYTYDSAKERMECHPEIADRYKKIIAKQPFFKKEKDALKFVIDNKRREDLYSCQIWAKIEKVDDVYRIQDWWMVTDDNKVKLYAEYIGMALMYDETRFLSIVDENVKIDDVVAYW